MSWSSADLISVNQNWQYSSPVEGSLFRLTQSGSKSGSFLIAQVQKNADGSVEFFGEQELFTDRPIQILQLDQPSYFTSRCLAFKRVSPPVSLESILRNIINPLFLKPASTNTYLLSPTSLLIKIEVNDTPLVNRIDTLSQAINAVTTSIGAIAKQFGVVVPEVAAIAPELQKIEQEIAQLSSSSSSTSSSTPPASSNPIYILQDNFVDVDNTLLSAHRMDVGYGWTTQTPNWKIVGNKVVGDSASGNGTIAYSESNLSDISVSCDITWFFNGNNSQQGLTLRCQDANNYLAARYLVQYQRLEIIQNNAGNESTLLGTSITLANNSTNNMKFEAVGQTLNVYIDGTKQLTTTTSFLGNATKCGLWAYADGDGTGAKWSNFEVVKSS
jgi:hypothetical protein